MCPGAASSSDGVAVPVPRGREVGGRSWGVLRGSSGAAARGAVPSIPCHLSSCCVAAGLARAPGAPAGQGGKSPGRGFAGVCACPGSPCALCVLFTISWRCRAPSRRSEAGRRQTKADGASYPVASPGSHKLGGSGCGCQELVGAPAGSAHLRRNIISPVFLGLGPGWGKGAARSIPRGCSSATR